MFDGWLLLIYTIPSEPSRKRAYVWRELKRLGAIYLRDGVAVLPNSEALEARLTAVADRITVEGGTSDLVVTPVFSEGRDGEIEARFRAERTAEYRELYAACLRFLRDVLHDVSLEEFGFPDVGKLESELGRLHKWHEQIHERDYFQTESAARVVEVLEKCDTAFDRFVGTAADRPEQEEGEDVFERLGRRGAPLEVDPADRVHE